jgi:ABC-type transporter MlaC component
VRPLHNFPRAAASSFGLAGLICKGHDVPLAPPLRSPRRHLSGAHPDRLVGRVFGARRGDTAPRQLQPDGRVEKIERSTRQGVAEEQAELVAGGGARAHRGEEAVGSFLDYGELAKRSLNKNWDKITAKQREEFVETLRELVERSYLRQMHGSPNYNIKYEKEEKTGSEADVTATLNTVSRGKKTKVALEYKMLWRDGHWVVYDVVTDEQSMLENYRAEFSKIINRDGFEALLKKMRKKLDEKDDDSE